MIRQEKNICMNEKRYLMLEGGGKEADERERWMEGREADGGRG